MPPIVHLILMWRLIATEWSCAHCELDLIGGYGAQHIVNLHPWCRDCKASWIAWFDREVASMWA